MSTNFGKEKNDHQNYVGYQLALRSTTKEVVKKLAIEPHPNVSHDLHLTLFEFEVDNLCILIVGL
jgi:hypothetical protein